LENSTNIGGGRTYPLEQIQRVCRWAHGNEQRTHLDGARLFNACVARGYSPRDVAQHFDSVSVCFSKGLGCPMGSILVGSRALMTRARKARKLFGGALRQAGIVAAAALYALDHHVDRLAEDHAHARLLAQELAAVPGLFVDPETVETNLVFIDIDRAHGTAAEFAAALKSRGLNIYALGPQRLRACLHLDVSREQVLEAAKIFRDVIGQGGAAASPAGAAAYA
jgi:threonine aldolase